MANGLGINGTPFFIMSAPGFTNGSEALFSGAISLSDFEQNLNKVKGL